MLHKAFEIDWDVCLYSVALRPATMMQILSGRSKHMVTERCKAFWHSESTRVINLS